MTETRSPIAPWEARLMARYALTAAAVSQLRGARRKDAPAVLAELQRTWGELAFICTIFPETAGNFFVKTSMEIVAANIDELDALIEKAAERTALDNDDTDNGEGDYAPR